MESEDAPEQPVGASRVGSSDHPGDATDRDSARRGSLAKPLARTVATILAAVAFGAWGVVLHPANGSFPAAIGGTIVVLDQQPGSDAAVSLTLSPDDSVDSPVRNAPDAPETLPLRNPRSLLTFRPLDNAVTLDVEDTRYHPRINYPASQRPPEHHWVVLLVGFPTLSFMTESPTQTRVRTLEERPEVQRAGISWPVHPHDYLIDQPKGGPSLSITFAGSDLAWSHIGSYVQVLAPAVSEEITAGAPNNLSIYKNATDHPNEHFAKVVTISTELMLPDDLADQLQQISGPPPKHASAFQWSWSSNFNSPVLATDYREARGEEHDLFIAGVLLGIAGAAAIAALLEVIDLIAAVRRTR
jgi:hypothetical protein